MATGTNANLPPERYLSSTFPIGHPLIDTRIKRCATRPSIYLNTHTIVFHTSSTSDRIMSSAPPSTIEATVETAGSVNPIPQRSAKRNGVFFPSFNFSDLQAAYDTDTSWEYPASPATSVRSSTCGSDADAVTASQAIAAQYRAVKVKDTNPVVSQSRNVRDSVLSQMSETPPIPPLKLETRVKYRQSRADALMLAVSLVVPCAPHVLFTAHHSAKRRLSICKSMGMSKIALCLARVMGAAMSSRI